MIYTGKKANPLADRLKARAVGGWFEIKAQERHAVVRIYDEIGYWGTTAKQFADELAALVVDTIEVQINSPGGDVFDGLAIYNALRAHPAKVTTRVDGIAASIASIIAQAGDHRVMLTGSQMMIHEAWGVAVGTADTMREFADVLDKQNANLAEIYARHSSTSVDELVAMMAAETYLGADETVAAGLADEVVDPGSRDEPATAAKVNRTFVDHADAVLADVGALIDRTREVVAQRAEKGKTISPASADLVAAVGDKVDELRALLEPTPPTKDDTPARAWLSNPADVRLRLELIGVDQ